MSRPDFRRHHYLLILIIGTAGGALSALLAGHVALVLGAFLVSVATVLAFVSPAAFLLAGMTAYATLHRVMMGVTFTLFGLDLNLSRLFVVALTSLLGLAAVARAGLGQRLSPPMRSHAAHLAFLIWCVLATVFHFENSGVPGIIAVARMASVAAIYYLAYDLARRNVGLLYLQLAVAVPAYITSFSALYFRLVAGSRPEDVLAAGATRVGGTLGGPVGAATVVLAGLPVYLIWWIAPQRPWMRLAGLAGFAAFGAVLVATLTRTAFLGALLLGIFALFFAWREGVLEGRLRRTFVVVGILLGIVLTSTILFVPSRDLEARLADIGGEHSGRFHSAEEIGSGRGLIWLTMSRIQRESVLTEWLVGHGLMSSPNYLARRIGFYKVVHNSYGQVLFDAGLIGLGFYLLMLLSVWADLSVGKRSVEGVIWRSYFLAFCFSTIFFNSYVYATGARWFTYLGLAQYLGALAASHCDIRGSARSTRCHVT